MVVCVFPNCANPEKVARVIKCVGPCKGTFHIACVHVSGPNLKACQESAGISWMCADCREDREDVILEKVKKNKLAIYDLATFFEKCFDVLITKMDTHTSMITELAASISTSNAINAEMLTTRQSLGASTPSPDESLSTVHERVRESLSVSLDRIFNRDNDGSGSVNRKRKGLCSESDSTNKRVKAGSNETQETPDRNVSQTNHGTQQQQQPPASAPNPDRNGVLPPHGSLGLPNNGMQQQPSTSSAPIPISAAPPNPQQSGSSAQESNAEHTQQLVDNTVPMDISHSLTGSTDESAPSQEASQVPPSAENIPGRSISNEYGQGYPPPPSAYQGFYYAPWQYSNQVIPWYPPNQAAMFQPEQMLWPPYLQQQNVAVNQNSQLKRNINPAAGTNQRNLVQNTVTKRVIHDCLTFCVKNLSPETTEDDVQSYIVARNIPPNAVNCTSLTKSRKKISFKSFKIDVMRRYAPDLTSKNFWPDGVSIAPYERYKAVALPATR